MSKDELVKEFTEAVSSGLLDKDLSSMIDLLNRRQAAVRHAITTPPPGQYDPAGHCMYDVLRAGHAGHDNC